LAYAVQSRAEASLTVQAWDRNVRGIGS